MVMRNSLSRTAILVVGFLGAASLHVVDFDGLTGSQAAYAAPEGGGLEPKFEVGKCPKEAICGKVVGRNAGCAGRACCDAASQWCQETWSSAGSTERIKTGKEGTCFTSDPNNKVDTCEVTDCGSKLCGEGVGCEMGDTEMRQKNALLPGGACGGDAS